MEVALANANSAAAEQGLPAEGRSLPALLKGNGYATGLVGKWHLGFEESFNPVRQGFDFFRGFTSGNVDYIAHVDSYGYYDWWDGDRLINEPGYVTHLITTHAVGFIERNLVGCGVDQDEE